MQTPNQQNQAGDSSQQIQEKKDVQQLGKADSGTDQRNAQTDNSYNRPGENGSADIQETTNQGLGGAGKAGSQPQAADQEMRQRQSGTGKGEPIGRQQGSDVNMDEDSAADTGSGRMSQADKNGQAKADSEKDANRQGGSGSQGSSPI